MRTGKRAVGLIVEDSRILIFRRFKEGRKYHAFIGGGGGVLKKAKRRTKQLFAR